MNIYPAFCPLFGFSPSLTNLPAGRQVTPGNKINNELLVINLAAVTGRRITDFRHIAKPYR
ncbi:MAG: hypothetical protein BGP13_14625 [Sphingobacteriales bacterium 40-81]|nr:MAG: hypothetical protein BGP13_14625 [Sphingobacteriales bacterium 40-81]